MKVQVQVSDGELTATREFNVLVTPVTDLSEAIKNGIYVYPNPVMSELFIHLDQQFIGQHLITLYDIRGKKMFELSSSENNVSVKVDALAEGLYYLNLMKPNGHTTIFKVLKR